MAKIWAGGVLQFCVIEMACPKGHVGRLAVLPPMEGVAHKHSIGFDGTVLPNMRCPVVGCGWQEEVVVLDDWATPT